MTPVIKGHIINSVTVIGNPTYKITRTRKHTPSPVSIAKKIAIYDYLIRFKRENDGLSPSIREIMDACDISSTSVVIYYLRDMQKAGQITMRGKRGIAIIGGVWMLKSEVPVLEPA